jgi:hypothetical protein
MPVSRSRRLNRASRRFKFLLTTFIMMAVAPVRLLAYDDRQTRPGSGFPGTNLKFSVLPFVPSFEANNTQRYPIAGSSASAAVYGSPTQRIWLPCLQDAAKRS